MLSLTVFGISAGVSYLGYLDASNKYAMMMSATDVSNGGHGVRYCTGFLTGVPLDFKGSPMLSLETGSYDVFQKIGISNGSAYTTTTKVFKNKTFDQASVELNGIDVSNLVPKLHEKFAVKLDHTYEAAAPVDLVNSNIRFGTFQMSLQNEALAGILKTFHGVEANPQTSYTVVGPFNGKCFYNNNRTFIWKNADIHIIRTILRTDMDALKTLSLICLVGGFVCGAYELSMQN